MAPSPASRMAAWSGRRHLHRWQRLPTEPSAMQIGSHPATAIAQATRNCQPSAGLAAARCRRAGSGDRTCKSSGSTSAIEACWLCCRCPARATRPMEPQGSCASMSAWPVGVPTAIPAALCTCSLRGPGSAQRWWARQPLLPSDLFRRSCLRMLTGSDLGLGRSPSDASCHARGLCRAPHGASRSWGLKWIQRPLSMAERSSATESGEAHWPTPTPASSASKAWTLLACTLYSLVTLSAIPCQ
mmetsp:Transcript_11376/g.35516  ORF Transcript_11376/g.35516 Transcript_11376/m.35516 type:complete len:243 (-) Transcript_11376:41-769(-)